MENLLEELATAKENFRKAEVAIIAAPTTTPKEEVAALYAARQAASDEVHRIGEQIADAVNAGEIPAEKILNEETAKRVGQVVAQLEEGQFWPLPGANYESFNDGSYNATGIIASEGGLKIVEGAYVNEVGHFGLTYKYIGVYRDAKCYNGEVTIV